jgi:uncharacterized protein YccT (UPF0319 family)
MTRSSACISVCILALSLASCQTTDKKQLYEGSRRPTSELSVVTIAPALDVSRVNEDKFFTFLESSGAKELKLAPGMNRIVVRFVGSYGDVNEGAEIVRSGDQSIELALAAGTRYRLETRTPSDRNAAERYVSGPIALWLIDEESGERIDLERHQDGNFRPLTPLAGDASAWAAESSASGAPRTNAASSATSPGATTPGTSSAATAAATTAAASASTADKSLVLEELERWWGRAEPEDRARFLDQVCPASP